MHVIFQVYTKTCMFHAEFAQPIHKGALFQVQAMYNHTLYSEEVRFIPQGNALVFVKGFVYLQYFEKKFSEYISF